MAEMLMDGIGSGNNAIVDDSHRLWVAGSITSMPAITAAADPATTKIGAAGLGSASLIGAYDGVNVQSTRIEAGSYLIVAGSISSMPTVSVSAGSESYIKGGSISIYNVVQTAGSIYSMPSISVSTGSNVWVQNPIGISGTNDIGSVVIKSAPVLGISGAKLDDLKVTNQVAGSIVYLPPITATNLDIRDLTVTSDSIVTLLGSTSVYNRIAGSVVNMPAVDINNPATIGSWTGYTGSIWSMPTTTVASTNLDIRDLVAVTDSVTTGSNIWIQNPVGISGTNVIGSVVIKSAPLIGVSGLIFINGNMTGSMAMKGIGSVIISSSTRLGGSIVNMPKTEIYVSGLISDFTTNLIQRMDYQDSLQPIYLGLALPGTVTSSIGWQLRKMGYSGTSSNLQLPVSVLFGSGNVNFDKVWDNRSGIYEAYS